uniref:Coiled-coil domain-containing protein 112 n=1 Tax=Oryzias sinensis TaxID=183150 RepID=A0A8C7XY06_9TELE
MRTDWRRREMLKVSFSFFFYLYRHIFHVHWMSHLTLEELKDLGHQIPYFLVFFTCVSNANQQHFAHEALSSGVSLQKQLMKIQKDVRKFQHHLIDVKPTPELIERLKDIMSDVETSINSLKEEQRSCFEKYLKEEMIVRLEISAYEKKIENWSLPAKSNPKLPSAPTTKIKLHNRDLPAEVRAPEDFLQKTGGPYGGWDQCDHQVFLRIWTKHRGQTSYRNEAKLHLPDKTAEEIKRHECWHLELLSLQEKKKKAIQLWKANKRQEHQIRKHSQEETEKAQRAEEEARILADRHRYISVKFGLQSGVSKE